MIIRKSSICLRWIMVVLISMVPLTLTPVLAEVDASDRAIAPKSH
jgi:hypothetical protein